ncbi:tetratricopeptide repeat protein [Plasticicumulans acidivorans]|uniref:Tetratricopeptide repeat protein n=1 Tax=Plasticicumulans acidivorans TaxID=886464 RepID=A0A317MR36_9GAMM|nr:tetratricopeptide repeat protein [Plasticicumulans acidivorans]PWV59072.1 tetratricopeptide repeat protein [Plasticicumulans acidivorans]
MTMPALRRTRLLTPLFLLLMVGCAAPSPFGAPVEDRTRAPAARTPVRQSAPVVEVQPLERPEPFANDGGAPLNAQPLNSQPLPAQPAPPPSNQAAVNAPSDTPAAPAPSPAPAPAPARPAAPPAEISRQGNTAVVALLDSAAGYVQSGDLDKAAASLERAQRIEPRNPSILYDLAQVRAHQGQYAQSEAMASKAIGMAGGDKALQAKAWRLIAAVRRAGGNAAGGDAAEAQAATLGQ